MGRPCAANAPVAACKSYVEVKTKKWTFYVWKRSFLHLRNEVLTVYHDKADCDKHKFAKRFTALRGCKWADKEWGIKIETKEAGWLHGVVHTKAEWATWLHAFVDLDHALNRPDHRMERLRSPFDVKLVAASLKDNADDCGMSSPERRVSFNSGVRVRTIPALNLDDKSELFYSDAELDEMKEEGSMAGAVVSTPRSLPHIA
ncbi:hypothetical protein H310_01473 [Aphanomyces invadans]|uniref:PH domain-containing protein n=1 Tax=Aphanomyces invadans TaxID=157072 RepID=A0A024USW2_9STRA|nr:hypothetical protein H310_01473 [Aphanomyces invadans]ETW09002.1 hypothetical protein H310_01473 [Aphanomyces invadans]RHY31446.1 hypothetical protein DYB32_003490 [Aphanomyces invadans]|eukprot:XP_008862807.1 hypothetical protein H310_01473 [Aphanomyces invadans]